MINWPEYARNRSTEELRTIHICMMMQAINHRHLDDDVYRDAKLGIKACRQVLEERDEALDVVRFCETLSE
jgi:hypothetical protein